MVNLKSKLRIILLLVLFAVFLTGCSLENLDLDLDLNQIIVSIMSELSDFWNDLVQILPDFGAILEGILSGLSGIGDAIRDMFADFRIF